jgi:hypothetical protein
MSALIVLFLAACIFMALKRNRLLKKEGKREIHILDKEYWQMNAISILVAIPCFFLFKPVMDGLSYLHPVDGFGGIWAIVVGFLIVIAIFSLITVFLAKALGIQAVKPRDSE